MALYKRTCLLILMSFVSNRVYKAANLFAFEAIICLDVCLYTDESLCINARLNICPSGNKKSTNFKHFSSVQRSPSTETIQNGGRVFVSASRAVTCCSIKSTLCSVILLISMLILFAVDC